MQSDEERFISFAMLGAWLHSAEDLDFSATFINANRRQRITDQLDGNGRAIHRLDAADRSAFLLCGFARENLLKGIAVHHDPTLIADGKLNKKILTHDLLSLVEKCGGLELPSHCTRTLKLFHEALVSWARYPCGLKHDETDYPDEMSGRLWEDYRALFEVLSDELRSRLAKGWTDPSGVWSKMEIRSFK